MDWFRRVDSTSVKLRCDFIGKVVGGLVNRKLWMVCYQSFYHFFRAWEQFDSGIGGWVDIR
jgi:hypothetical protein